MNETPDTAYNTDHAPILTITLHGSNTARFIPLGLEVTKPRGSVIAPLCRKMLAAGMNPKATVKLMRGGTLCFIPTTLESWGRLSVVEPDSQTIRFRLWQPSPAERLHTH